MTSIRSYNMTNRHYKCAHQADWLKTYRHTLFFAAAADLGPSPVAFSNNDVRKVWLVVKDESLVARAAF
jgi:hypothetical protein